MSLIQDALKASQREKDRRSTGGPASPLIVPLRSKPRTDFNWKNAVSIAGSLVVIVVSLGVLYVRLGGTIGRQAPASPASPIAMPVVPQSAAPTRADSARQVVAAPAQKPNTKVAPPAAAPADTTTRIAAIPKSVRRPVPVKHDTSAVVLQSARRPDSAAVATQPSGGGHLRISVEQPRAYEASRLLATGIAAHRAGDLDAARSAYERVLAMSPNDVDALNNLGVLLGTQREYDRAEQVLRRVVLLAPRNAGAWNNLGTVLSQAGHAGDAIAAFQQALQVDPSNAAARVSLAQQYIAIGSPARARELLEEAIAANPSLAEAQYTLGQACEMEKDWPAAIRAYNAFVRVAPARMAADVERVRRRVEMLSARVK